MQRSVVGAAGALVAAVLLFLATVLVIDAAREGASPTTSASARWTGAA